MGTFASIRTKTRLFKSCFGLRNVFKRIHDNSHKEYKKILPEFNRIFLKNNVQQNNFRRIKQSCPGTDLSYARRNKQPLILQRKKSFIICVSKNSWNMGK